MDYMTVEELLAEGYVKCDHTENGLEVYCAMCNPPDAIRYHMVKDGRSVWPHAKTTSLEEIGTLNAIAKTLGIIAK